MMAIVGLWVQNGLFGTPYGLKLGLKLGPWFRASTDEGTAAPYQTNLSAIFLVSASVLVALQWKLEVHRLQRV